LSQDFRRQLEGCGLTTANILYRRPDHPWLLQSYVWQDYDLCPVFPALNKFLNFWLETLEVALGHRGACAVDQACRDPRDRWRVPAALRTEVRLSDVRSTLSPSGAGAPSAKRHLLVIFCIRGLSTALTCSACRARFLLHAMRDHRQYRWPNGCSLPLPPQIATTSTMAATN